jgi:hypothetical protein
VLAAWLAAPEDAYELAGAAAAQQLALLLQPHGRRLSELGGDCAVAAPADLTDVRTGGPYGGSVPAATLVCAAVGVVSGSA